MDKSKTAEREEKILKFWRDNKIFEKSLEKPAPNGEFTFYDGPPFASGTPHFGHLLPTSIKDAVPRFWTMRGFRVARRWGWDCHGLPVENLVEKELGLKSKKEIENYGVEKFNAVARESVLRYADIWREQIPRFGRFVDMDNDYRTMDANYTESVWWAFKTLHGKNLIYEGFKPMHLCPHCGTTLSNFEVAQGYKDIADISVYAKFKTDDKTFLLAWTTTPWTLPGNVALAVGKDIDYVRVGIMNKELGIREEYILAKARLVVLKQEYEILEEFKGEKLVGKSYEPIFDYYKGQTLGNRDRGWKIYAADFVTTEDGTGIVHIAPAFGEADMKLGEKEKLPFVQHVGVDGKFKSEVSDFAGQDVKPKDDPTRADVAVLKFLAAKNLLFAKEKITHSYPHCWRCETPLLNYAASSWFVKVTALKNKLLAENEKIHWVPETIGKYRFGNWLAEARDWAISRSRFWGAPLPVWRCDKCGKLEIIGSIEDIKKHLKPRNRYIVMRHGESENNVKGILNTDLKNNVFHLTENGKAQTRESAEKLAVEKIDLIFASPFARTIDTAELVREKLGLPKENLVIDERLKEISGTEFEGSPESGYGKFYKNFEERFTKRPNGGENYLEIKKRLGDFLQEIDTKHTGKNILIVTHGAPAWLLEHTALGLTPKQMAQVWKRESLLPNSQYREFSFLSLPLNENHELDLHRPFIDSIEFDCACSEKMRRVPEVFDCWFESGSMPFAEWHYPFDSAQGKPFEKIFNPKPGWFQKAKRFPADFIAEGLDQTRGWFYSMLVLGVALFGKSPYKNVIVNGLVLAEDGRKMSKSLKNYPDLMPTVEKYGADAIRLYLLSSPAVRAEDARFSEKGVDEVAKKVLGRLDNVLAFYLLYADKNLTNDRQPTTSNILDQWILARLNQLISEVTKAMENYELDKAARPIGDFVDDLSTWYLRRSRERIKNGDGDGRAALATLRFVLLELSKIIAPFTPFFSEYLYKTVGGEKESVHLDNWPACKADGRGVAGGPETNLLEEMKEVRRIVSLALEARAKANIKVRQPLASLRIKFGINSHMVNLIKDEVNVKEITFSNELKNEVELDTTITPELKREGNYREAVRQIQELRKEKGLRPGQLATLATSAQIASTGLLQEFEDDLKHSASLERINHGVLAEGDFELR
ncbi:MAG: class I tRNA ligase family protein [Candidatus Paceibacterota bacterium]|jgi:isoleucyl-tRNA synthetase